jgi:hypothetical protein
MILFEPLYESSEIEKIESFQYFLRKKNREIIRLIFEIIFEKRKNKNLIKKAESIKKNIEKEYRKYISCLQTINDKIEDDIRKFLRKEGLNYLSIEKRIKSLNSLLEKIFRSVIGSFYDPYKQNRPNDFLAYRIITENNNETLAILEKISKIILASNLPLEFYYKENTPLLLSLKGKKFPTSVISFDNLNSEGFKLLLYKLSNVDKESYRRIEKMFQKKFKQKKAEVEDNNGLTKKAYVVNHPLAREAIFFYDVEDESLYLILNTSFTVEGSYRKFVNLINLIKEKGFESIHKLSLGKEYIGRVPYGLYKIDYYSFFKPLGFKLENIKPYHLKNLEELKLEDKGLIGKIEICSYSSHSSFPLAEIQVIDYNTHSFRERNGFYDHKEYEKRRTEKTRKNLKKIYEEYRLENRQIEILKKIGGIFIPTLYKIN